MLYALLFGLTALAAQEPVTPALSPLKGVWERSDRFIEFTDDGKMRIVLKPYYGFVYEDTGYIDCEYSTDSVGVTSVTPRYPGEKKLRTLTLAILQGGIYLDAMARVAAGGDEAKAETEAEPDAESPASEAASFSPSLSAPRGVYRALASAGPILLYKEDPPEDAYAWVFEAPHYWRIRYWKTDARFRDRKAVLKRPDGTKLEVEKFLRIDGELFTCVTGTGTTLRNYETGIFELRDAAFTFRPDRPVYEGTEARYREPVPFAMSEDGGILAFGEPWLTRSSIANLDEAIRAHNAKRRPARKPIFGYMELDFHWDEIERIRGNGRKP
jgi:hypothetical protein